MDRRGFVHVALAGALAASTGCSAVNEATTPPPHLEEVHVRNSDVIGHEFRVAIEQAGRLVHETTFELGPREPREYGGPYRPEKYVRCEWSGRGPFVVACTVDGDRTASVRLDRSDSDGEWSYREVEFTVTDTGRLDPDVWSEQEHLACEEPTPTPAPD